MKGNQDTSFTIARYTFPTVDLAKWFLDNNTTVLVDSVLFQSSTNGIDVTCSYLAINAHLLKLPTHYRRVY